MDAEKDNAKGMTVNYVADIYTGFPDKFGIPRQSGIVPELTGRIVFRPEYRDPEALRAIEGFSHLWVLFDFSLSHRDNWSPTVRPPRLGGNTRVGVFASRSPFRPNPIGLSCVKLIRVEHTIDEGDVLIVGGVDMVSGTPVIDIKPYLPISDRRDDAVGGYSDDRAGYRLEVVLPPDADKKLPEELIKGLAGCLAEDPRPSYQEDPERVYGMEFEGFEVRFKVAGGTATVTEIERKQEAELDV